MTDQERAVLPQQLFLSLEDRPLECPPLIVTEREFLYFLDNLCDRSSFFHSHRGIYLCNLPNSTNSVNAIDLLDAMNSATRNSFEADCWGWMDKDKDLPVCTVPVIDSCNVEHFASACSLYNTTYFQTQGELLAGSCSDFNSPERFECLDRHIQEKEGRDVWCQGRVGTLGTFLNPVCPSEPIRDCADLSAYGLVRCDCYGTTFECQCFRSAMECLPADVCSWSSGGSGIGCYPRDGPEEYPPSWCEGTIDPEAPPLTTTISTETSPPAIVLTTTTTTTTPTMDPTQALLSTSTAVTLAPTQEKTFAENLNEQMPTLALTTSPTLVSTQATPQESTPVVVTSECNVSGGVVASRVVVGFLRGLPPRSSDVT